MEDLLKLPYNHELVEMVPEDNFSLSQPIELLKCDTVFGVREKSLYELPKVNEGSFLKRQFKVDQEDGKQFEVKFKDLMQSSLSYKVHEVPFWSYNYKQHIDFEVQDASGKCAFVDVKAPRSLRKSRLKNDPMAKPQNKYVVAELMPFGSLFGSKADYIAFGQTDGTFVVCDTQKLQKLVKTKMQTFTNRSAWPETSLWCPYVRSYEGRNSAMMYMDLDTLNEQGCVLWKLC